MNFSQTVTLFRLGTIILGRGPPHSGAFFSSTVSRLTIQRSRQFLNNENKVSYGSKIIHVYTQMVILM